MILVLLAIGIISLPVAVVSEEPYGVEKIVLGKWGNKPGEIGLGNDPTVEHGPGAIMPNDIDVDAAGNLYVMDQVNSRVQVFGQDNKLKSIFYDEGHKEWLSGVTGIAALKDGSILLKNSEKMQFGLVKNKTLSLLHSMRHAAVLPMQKSCDGKLIFNDYLFDEHLDEVQDTFSPYQDRGGNFYKIEGIYGENYLRKYDHSKKMIFSVQVPGFYVKPLGLDSSENIYIMVDPIYLFYIFNKNGQLLIKANVAAHKEISGASSIKLSCNGDVYFFVTSEGPDSYEERLRKGRYEIFRLRFQKN